MSSEIKINESGTENCYGSVDLNQKQNSLGKLFVSGIMQIDKENETDNFPNFESTNFVEKVKFSNDIICGENENEKKFFEMKSLQTLENMTVIDNEEHSDEFINSIMEKSYLGWLSSVLDSQLNGTSNEEFVGVANSPTQTQFSFKQNPTFNFYVPTTVDNFDSSNSFQKDNTTIKKNKRTGYIPQKRSRRARNKTKNAGNFELIIEGNSSSAASIRERNRMLQLNTAFETLRCRVPTFPYEKRLSKIDTLKLASSYIALLRAVLNSGKPPREYIKECTEGSNLTANEWYTSDLFARLSWIKWE